MTDDIRNILTANRPHKPTDLVFIRSNGQGYKEIPQTFRSAVKAIGLNEGIADRRVRVVFHTLRHTFASWLVQNGESLVTVARLLGHSTLAMVNRYAHLSPQQERRAAMAIADKFNSMTDDDVEAESGI